MSIKNEYLLRLLGRVKHRNAHEPEFIQAVEEVLESLEPVAERHPEYIKKGIFEHGNNSLITLRIQWRF